MTSSAVTIQTSPQSVPSTPSWFGAAAIMAKYLARSGVLESIQKRARFARPRFGTYEVIDFVAILIGYALSSVDTIITHAKEHSFLKEQAVPCLDGLYGNSAPLLDVVQQTRYWSAKWPGILSCHSTRRGKERLMSLSSIPTTDSTIRLRDGRRLQSMEVGKIDGSPIFHFHGNGSSRLEVLTVASSAESLGVRLIGLDRPGIGRSDAKAGYRILDWPDDVVEVADQLGIERFAVEGLSGGGPYALACAYKIPHRLTACGLISPETGPFIKKAGPPSLRVAVWMLVHLPWLVRALVRLSTRLRGSDEASIEKMLIRNGARLGAADDKLLRIPEIRKAFARATAEGYRQGADASTKDGMVFAGPWGFQVEEITFEKVFLWQGEQDRVMPEALARLLAQALPHCTATFYPDEGHLSTFVNHAQDIWKALSV